MASMQALLKIKAITEGDGAIAAMARGLGSLKQGAERASGGLKGLLTSAGGLSGALGGLIPLVSGVGLVAMGKKAIDAADDMNDLAQKTGVSVEQLSRFQQAARDSGSSLEDVGKGLIVLGRNLNLSVGATQRFGDSVEEMARKAEQAERDQTDALRNQAESRITLLENETDDRLKELNKRYRKEQRLLDDRYNDQSDREREASDQALTQQERALDEQYEQRRVAIENDVRLTETARSSRLSALRYEQEDRTRALRNRFENERKERSRQLRDAQQADEDALNDQKTNEEEIIKKSSNRQSEIIKKGAQDQIDALAAGERGPEAFRKAMQRLGVSAVDATGKIRPTGEVMLDIATALAKLPDGADKASLAMDLFNKKLGPGLIPVLNNGREGIEAYNATITTDFAQSADAFNDKLGALQSRVEGLTASLTKSGLLPFFDKLLDSLTRLGNAFGSMPRWLQATTAVLGGLLVILPGIVSFLLNIIQLAGVLGLTFSSAGSIIAGILTVIQLTFAGVLTFLSGTVLPALLAFFSGPVGWTVLAVAAVVAMGIAFRKPLGDFLKWLWKWGEPIRKFWLDLWNGAAGFARKAFETAAGVVKNIFRGILQYVVDRINLAVGLINVLIKAFNKLPAPDIPLVPPMKVPAFAQGGTVNRPTLAMVGEGGQREYIIPESKMAAASSSFLAGARGNAVLAGSGGKSPVINITTGPVMEFDGQRYVTVTDMERAMRLTAEGVIGRLRTPSARIALGMA
jgi:hypothetical protein